MLGTLLGRMREISVISALFAFEECLKLWVMGSNQLKVQNAGS